MPLTPYEEFAEEPLAFPVGGKTYVVKPLGYKDGIRFARFISGEDKSLLDAPAEEGWKFILGDTFDEMVADNVPMEVLARAGFAAMTDFQFGRDEAERVWRGGLDPKGLAERLQRAVAAARAVQDLQPSSSTGEANATRRPASMTGTSSQTTRKRTPAKGKRSASST